MYMPGAMEAIGKAFALERGRGVRSLTEELILGPSLVG